MEDVLEILSFDVESRIKKLHELLHEYCVDKAFDFICFDFSADDELQEELVNASDMRPGWILVLNFSSIVIFKCFLGRKRSEQVPFNDFHNGMEVRNDVVGNSFWVFEQSSHFLELLNSLNLSLHVFSIITKVITLLADL